MTQTQTTESDRAIARRYYAREAELAARWDRAFWRAECIALAEQIGDESWTTRDLAGDGVRQGNCKECGARVYQYPGGEAIRCDTCGTVQIGDES